MKRLRLILGIALIVIASGIVLALIVRFHGTGDVADEEREALSPSDETASVEATELKYTESEGGKTLWEIEAEEAMFFQDKAKTEFKKINVIFYYKEDYELILSGDSGELNTDTKNIVIRDNVKIKVEDDYTLSTDSLNYSSEEHQISTEDPIEVTGPDVSFHGNGLVFDLNSEELFIKSNVSTDFTQKGKKTKVVEKDALGFDDLGSFEGPLHITSSGFYGNRKNSLIRYTGGAHASHKEATLRASSITIFFKGEGGEISKIEARGNVKLVRSDITATCNLMTFNYNTKILTLEKDPVIWRGDDMVKGDKILYYLDEKKSVALGGDTNRAHVTIYPKEEF